MRLKNRLLVRYFYWAVSIICVCMAIGFTLNAFLISSVVPQFIPYVTFAKIVDRMNLPDKASAVREVQRSQDAAVESKLELIDLNGNVIFPLDRKNISYPKEILESLRKPYDFKTIKDVDSNDHALRLPFSPPAAIVRLSGEPVFYLYFGSPRATLASGKISVLLPILVPVFLFGFLLLGIGITVWFVSASLRKHTRRADEVISELQKGNLKARFTIGRDDEVGYAMSRFNRMADEIEILVEHLREVESSRTKLLEELAHDLRTPIASLKGLLETLQQRPAELDAKMKGDLMGMAIKETEYFSRLMDDLLFLARVNVPTFRSHSQSFDIQSVMSEEIYDCEFKANKDGLKKSIQYVDASSTQITMHGDPYLIRRLLRNAFDNSVSFAKNEVIVTIEIELERIRIIIIDDGPGFSQDSLQYYGKRRVTRKMEAEADRRVSVGLGSVVMKAICTTHQGSLSASNQIDADGKVKGARIEIILGNFSPV